MVHQFDKDISSMQFNSVLEEIGNIEDQLKANGLSKSSVDKLLDFAHELYSTPIERLSENAQLRLGKIIFDLVPTGIRPLPPLSKA